MSGFSGPGYSEGLWTPTILGDSVAGVNTYNTQLGHYAKFGNIVFVEGRIVLSAKDAAMAGNVKIGGLPFTFRNVTSLNPGFAISVITSIDLTAGYSMLCIFGVQNTTEAYFQQAGDNIVNALLPAAQFAATSGFGFSGFYLV